MKTSNSKLIIGLVIISTACSKTPKASFTTDKDVYTNGEKIQTTNTSENGHTYNWKVSNSLTEYSDESPALITNGAGEYLITLTAYGRTKSKANTTSKTVTVNPGQGQVMHYASSETALTLTVEIDGTILGSPTQTFSSPPDCGVSGAITSTLSEGLHTITVHQASGFVSNIIKVDGNVCKKVKL